MLKWTAIFFVIAIVAGILGFGGLASAAGSVAKILFVAFLILALIAGVSSLLKRGNGSLLAGLLAVGLPVAASSACVPPQNVPVSDALADLDDRARPKVTRVERTFTSDDDEVSSTMDLTYDDDGCIASLQHTIDGEMARDVTFTCSQGQVMEAEVAVLDGDPITVTYERDENDRLIRARGEAEDGELLFDAHFDYQAADVVSSYDADVDLGSLEYALQLDYTYDDRDLVTHAEGDSESELGWWIFGVSEERALTLDIAYDDAWRIDTVTQELEGPGDDHLVETTFAYDDLGRVTGSDSTDGAEMSVAYDDQGRVVRVEEQHGDDGVKTVYTYDEGMSDGLVLTPEFRHGRFFDLYGQSHGRMEAELEVLTVPYVNDLVLAD